jgi:polysaccharide biosynthesis/export protein
VIHWMFIRAAAAESPPATEYTLGPGDVLQVEVLGESGIGGTVVISATGEVSLTYCGLVPLVGKTVFEAEQALRACLADGYLVSPQVAVRVDQYRSQKVEVLGAVEKPGQYYLTSLDSTLRSVLGQAGGVKAEKSVGRVVVTHVTGERTVVPLESLMGPAGDLALRRGDVIDVGQGELVWVGGEVVRPGSVGFMEGMTLTQAIIKAGGPTPLARLRGAYLVRDEDRVQVNVQRMLKGKDEDLALQPGDRVVVPESAL